MQKECQLPDQEAPLKETPSEADLLNEMIEAISTENVPDIVDFGPLVGEELF